MHIIDHFRSKFRLFLVAEGEFVAAYLFRCAEVVGITNVGWAGLTMVRLAWRWSMITGTKLLILPKCASSSEDSETCHTLEIHKNEDLLRARADKINIWLHQSGLRELPLTWSSWRLRNFEMCCPNLVIVQLIIGLIWKLHYPSAIVTSFSSMYKITAAWKMITRSPVIHPCSPTFCIFRNQKMQFQLYATFLLICSMFSRNDSLSFLNIK